ncbi:hypothetical protein L249_0225 [Ophiocordyceps polyrhachis-furcata BCC 54312]|uniref:Enoyl-CoA hydratase n=1 Tax=Ophiocordyceps polyrhachis-furcata BCC 54312 TaxID=1330021 RepID=A0A367LFA0_9HYPO|nr:hypothetical protein L249_0225 [Ophiocordyceps polyrhachis-furcata BCC 54312]
MARPNLPESYNTFTLPDLLFAHHPPTSTSVTPVITVSLDRPSSRNGFTVRLANSVIQAFDLLSSDPRVRAIVLTSSDKSNRIFCAGMDFNDQSGHDEDEKAEHHRDLGGRVSLAIYHCAKPVVAAINGSAVGVGITMTLPANIRVVSRDASVGFVFSRRGITLEACSSFFLPRLVGTSRAVHLVSTGAVYPASHRLLADLFSEIVAPDQVLATALAIADDLAANASLLAMRLNKDLLYRAPASPEEAHLVESRLLHPLFRGPDFLEGVTSFLQKRKPNFRATMDDAPSSYPWWTPVDVRAKSKL